MSNSFFRFGMLLNLIGSFCYVFCQPTPSHANPEQRSTDASIYKAFFLEIVQVKDLTGPILLNGQPSSFMMPGVQATLGLTEEESKILVASAVDCKEKLTPIEQSLQTPLFEARLETIRTGAIPKDMRLRIEELERARDQVVLDHIQQVKSSFGESRFQQVNLYVQSKKDERFFFPPVAVKQSATSRKPLPEHQQ